MSPGEPGGAIEVPTELAAPERRRFLLLVGIVSLGTLPLDVLGAWPSRGLVLLGGACLSAALLGAPVLLRGATDAAARTVARGLAVVCALSFTALVWGTGGAAGPYLGFFPLVPIVFTVLVPDDLPATLLAAGIVGVAGLARTAGEPTTTAAGLAFGLFAFAGAGAYSVVATHLYRRMRLREARAREDLAASERRRERDALERDLTSKRLEVISEAVNDIVVLLAEDGTIVQVNERAVESYGYRREELVGLSVGALRDASTQADLPGTLARAKALGAVRYRTLHRRRDGSTLPIESNTRRIDIGGAVYYQAVIRDLTEEHRVRAASDYQAMLLANLYDAIIAIDTQRRITAWNPAAERAFGWTSAEALGKDAEELLCSTYPEGHTLQTVLSQAARVPRFRTEVRRRTRSGAWVDVEATLVALRSADGHLIGYVSVNRDISVRKRAEAAARASQAWLHRIIQSTDEGIWVIDPDARTEFVNTRAAELFGVHEDDVLGRPILDAIPEHARAVAEEIRGAYLRGENLRHELKVPCPGRADRSVIVSMSILRDDAGRVSGAVAVFTEVSELRRAQDDLQQAQKLEAVGRLAAGVAHEINTPIQYIGDNTRFVGEAVTALAELARRARSELAAGEARSALERAAEELDADYLVEQAPRAIARTLEGVGRVATIVRAMKEFAHPDQKEMVATDLNRMLHATLEVARSEYKYVADVQTDCAELPPVTCHAGDLNQVFLNLVVNAAHAIEDVVKGTASRGTIRVATRLEGAEVVVAISDTGGGIPEAIRGKVFEPFFTTKEVGRGTGQGLAIARNIVAKHQGQLTFTSAIGQGTTFFVRIPAERAIGGVAA